jgi:hypothetical protein
MASHESFGHRQPKLWAKERPVDSQELTRSQRALGECNMALKSSRGELQDWFRARPDRKLGWKVMMAQSSGNPNWDSFGTPLWESRDKQPLGCGRGGTTQRILYGGKVVASPESGPWWVKWVQGRSWLVPTPKGCRMNSNELVVGLGCKTV